MKSLVINCGSSSIKYTFFDNQECVISGMCDAIGLENSKIKYTYNGIKEEVILPLENHGVSLVEIIKLLKEKVSLEHIDVVVHRLVHGGEKFQKTTRITPEIIAKLKELIPLAPLHNPANILGVETMLEILPDVPQVGVFDTAFHASMPEEAYLYGIPYEYYKKYALRKYGFHGTSHKFVSQEAKKLVPEMSKMINCHLGNGASICAIKDGKSMDTSMGFTPLQGLVMGTRSGIIDPAIVTYLMKAEHLTHEEVEHILNKKSGLLGLSQMSSDCRVIEDNYGTAEGATRAMDVFDYRLIKLIGGYVAALNGIDVLTFTGGVGENSALIREKICERFTFMGLKLDPEKNNVRGKLAEISTDDSKVKVFVIPTNEELEMVQQAEELIVHE